MNYGVFFAPFVELGGTSPVGPISSWCPRLRAFSFRLASSAASDISPWIANTTRSPSREHATSTPSAVVRSLMTSMVPVVRSGSDANLREGAVG